MTKLAPKERYPPQWQNTTARKQHNVGRRVVCGLIALGSVLFLSYRQPLQLFPGSSGRPWESIELHKEAGFQWRQISPSPELEYHDCFDGFQCARLEVPMDHRHTDGKGRKMAVAVARLPAKVPVTDPRYGGAILINPGGPGGSGVAQLLISGRNLQTIADADADPASEFDGSLSDLPKYYDIIGFDPRGVNNTTPGFTCFPDTFSRRNWELQAEAEGMLGSGPGSLIRNWQRSMALAESCSQVIATSINGEEALGEHVNTPQVTADMLEIVERHGQWRERQGKAAQAAQDMQHGYDNSQAFVERTRWNKGKEKLLYWGRSYGTVLGATFAALYPDRVERVVLDGVVDLDAYYLTSSPSVLADSDAIFERFAEYCHTVGSEGCPFHHPGGPDAIKKAYRELLSRIYDEPFAVPASLSHGPEVITWTDVKVLTRIAMYQPLIVFPLFAEFLAELKQGNGTNFVGFKQGSREPSCLSDECLLAGPWSRECSVPGGNENYATAAILCTDAENLGNVDRQGFKDYWESLKATSETLGDYWAHARLDCVGWKAKAKWKFTGPFGANTSYPLLWIGNTLDPVTPLRSAQKMSLKFPGSVVLQQDSEGHTTLAAPSFCVAKAVRTYFQTGELPAPGTVCQADLKPLIGASPSSVLYAANLTPGDRALYAAIEDEVRSFRTAGPFRPL
ncbi:hypothetical protein DTO280E4_6783 [Paecilomyces variotii]|nr:hypothetical protein DTO280E4_6783 [Paecilomyces variotii]